jgi:hypothetical protein
LLAGTLTLRADERDQTPKGKLDQVRPGVSARQVRDLLGPPLHSARQIFYQGYVEQWVYEQPEPARIDFLFRLGWKEPQVQAIRRPLPPRP